MNNYNNFNYDWYRNMNNNYPFNTNNNYQNGGLYTPKEGFERGNLFQNLYSEYKNYKLFPLKANDEQEKLLLDIQALAFAIQDLNLYLDIHPNDQSMLMLFNDYKRQKMELTKEYERRYGPMTVSSDNTENTSFEWVNTKWPWEERYV